MVDTVDNQKVVVIGSGGVGKSCLTLQFVQGQFVDGHDPTIEDSYQKLFSVDDKSCRLDILDTAGQEEFAAMRNQNMRQGQGFFLVYSVTDRASFQKISELITMVKRIKGAQAQVPLVLCANKSDKPLGEHRVTEGEGRELATSIGAEFFCTSAKTTQNVHEAFTELVTLVRKFGTEPCECVGACRCRDKCDTCGTHRNAHSTADHTFKVAKAGLFAKLCTIL